MTVHVENCRTWDTAAIVTWMHGCMDGENRARTSPSTDTDGGGISVVDRNGATRYILRYKKRQACGGVELAACKACTIMHHANQTSYGMRRTS